MILKEGNTYLVNFQKNEDTQMIGQIFLKSLMYKMIYLRSHFILCKAAYYELGQTMLCIMYNEHNVMNYTVFL